MQSVMQRPGTSLFKPYRTDRKFPDLSCAEQHVAGAVDFGRQIVRPAMVGVQFDHQPAMGFLDLVWSGSGLHAEDRVSFLDGHIAARRPRRATSAAAAFGAGAAAASAGELIAPVGVEAIEIGLEQ